MEPMELVPQEMTRVFLNLIGNGFYAATKRARGDGEAGYCPTLQVSTRDLGDAVEVRARDNGTGIPSRPEKEPVWGSRSATISSRNNTAARSRSTANPAKFTEFTIRLPRNGQTRGGAHERQHFGCR